MACRMSSSLSYSSSSQRRYSNRLSSPLTRPSALSQDQGPLGPQIPQAAPPPSRPFNSRCRRRRRRIFCVLSVAVCRATPAARSPPSLPSRPSGGRLGCPDPENTLLILARGRRGRRTGRKAAAPRTDTVSLPPSLSLLLRVRSFSLPSPIKKRRTQLESSAVAVRTCNRE